MSFSISYRSAAAAVAVGGVAATALPTGMDGRERDVQVHAHPRYARHPPRLLNCMQCCWRSPACLQSSLTMTWPTTCRLRAGRMRTSRITSGSASTNILSNPKCSSSSRYHANCFANMFGIAPHNGQPNWGKCSNGRRRASRPTCRLMQPNNFNGGEDCMARSIAGTVDDTCNNAASAFASMGPTRAPPTRPCTAPR